MVGTSYILFTLPAVSLWTFELASRSRKLKQWVPGDKMKFQYSNEIWNPSKWFAYVQLCFCPLVGLGQTKKCVQFTRSLTKGVLWKQWHAADRFWEVYRHVWSKVSAVGECLPSLRPSIPERTLLPSCLLHLILWPELAVRASKLQHSILHVHHIPQLRMHGLIK